MNLPLFYAREKIGGGIGQHVTFIAFDGDELGYFWQPSLLPFPCHGALDHRVSIVPYAARFNCRLDGDLQWRIARNKPGVQTVQSTGAPEAIVTQKKLGNKITGLLTEKN